MSDRIIEVKDLEYKYGNFKAVDKVSFFVREGEIFSFLGPNGAGKSTVINILTTLLPVQSGSVTIAGYDLAKEPQQVRRSIGIVFQDETLDRDLTVWETLELHGRIYSMPKAERKERIDEIIKLVELEEKRNVRTRFLSGGMKRRLEIGRGLMTRPKVLFLDEPTIGLDTQTRRRLWDYIKKVNDSGTTIFLTTHYMDEADQVSNWIDILDHGKIIASGDPTTLKDALGNDMIYLDTSDNAAAEEMLRGMKAVRAIKAAASGLAVTINADGTHCLPIIMNRLRERGIEIISVNLKKPTLDDVFVHHTGRDIREAGAGKLHRLPSPKEADEMSWEFLTIYWRDMLRFVRFRIALVVSLIQPALWMALYGAAMSSNFSRLSAGMTVPEGATAVSYLTFMGAGVIALTTLFTSLFGGITLLFDKNWGLMRELLASPMPRNHIILGIGLSGVTKSFIQVMVIMGFGLLIGVRFFPGYTLLQTAGAVLGVLLFVGVFSIGFLFLSSAISMSMDTPEGLQAVITLLTLPLFFASNALYPIDAFPGAMRMLAQFNPLTHLVNGVRYFAVGNDFYAIGIHYVYSSSDIMLSFLALTGFAAVMFLVAWRVFKNAVVT